MPTSHKPPKAAPTEQPQPDVVETVTVATAPGADERPGIDSMFPPDGYVVPASGVVAASVGVSRSAAGIPLGRVEWYVDGALVGTDKVPRDAATWNVSRSLPIPIGDHEIQVWLWNLTGPGRNHRIRNVTRPDLVDRAPPAFQIVAPANNTRLPVGKVAVYGWAQDPSGVAAAEWSLDGGAYQAILCTPDPQIKNQVSWRFEFDLAAGPHTVALRFRDGKGNTTPATAASAITLTGVAAYKPFDDIMSLRAYLEDLLGYAATHVKKDASTPLAVADLINLFCQPFDTLAQGIDESKVRFANQPLNQLRAAIEVLRAYVRACGDLPPLQCVAHWRFDEGHGTTAADATGNGNTATLKGPIWRAGRVGSTLSFDGASSFVDIKRDDGLRALTNRFTLAFWANPQAPRDTDKEADSGVSGASGQRRYALGSLAGHVEWASPDHAGVAVSVGNNGVSVYEHSSNYLPARLVYDAEIKGWTHVAVVYQDGAPSLYLNGRKVKDGKKSPKPFVHACPESIGKRSEALGGLPGYYPSPPGFYQGQLDDVRIYAGALAADDVAALAHVRAATARDTADAASAAAYRQAAYRALLNQAGASYEEIRLARGADDAKRDALAARLGIASVHLDDLLLRLPDVTEAALERLFGLADTTRDPAIQAADALLLTWRRDYLPTLWQQQDADALSEPDAATVIVDPDLIGPDDLQQAAPGDPAYDLWQTRTNALASILGAFKQKRDGQPDQPLSAFEAIVADGLGQPAAILLELDARQKAGKDITSKDIVPNLNQLNLTYLAFMRLLRVRNLIVNGTVDNADWDDVFAILVQANKLRTYPAWRAEEIDKQIALTPALFKIADADPDLPLWRATWQARLDWQDRLQSRIDQLQALEDALSAAVAKVEEQTLPLLRDAVVSSMARRLGLSLADAADWYTDQLQVDVKVNGSQQTTRLLQAIETVQDVLFSLRSGQLPAGHPAAAWKLAVDDDHFDDEWDWLGEYATWRAAMAVFYFPENMLLPTLRMASDPAHSVDPLYRTKAFETLISEVRKRPQLTPAAARALAGGYLDNLIKDLGANLNPAGLRTAILASRPAASASPAYLTDLHTETTLRTVRGQCADAFAFFAKAPVPNYIHEIFYTVPLFLAQQLQQAGAHLAALDWFQRVYAYSLQPGDRKIYRALEIEANQAPVLTRGDHWLREELNPHALVAGRAPFNGYTRYTLMSLASCLMEFADAEFTRDTVESLSRARTLYLTARGLLLLPEFDPPIVISPQATVYPNPLLESMRLRVETQLTKLREGRNIAGLRRQIDLPVSLAPSAGEITGDRRLGPPPIPLRPTPYRYSVLIERSKQLVTIAQQVEAAYLAALEKQDAENYNLLKAKHDLELAQAGQELQNRRVNEAQAGVGVARSQLQRAQVMSERYQALSNMGLNQYEQQMVRSYQQAIGFIQQAGAASAQAAQSGGDAAAFSSMAAAESAFMAVGAGMSLTYIPNFVAASLYMQAAAAASSGAAAQARAAVLSANAQVAQTQASIAGVYASLESRKREWETQAAIAAQDIAIGQAQIHAAQAHVDVTEQERRIAQIQTSHAQAAANFLARKFTSAELYEWMSGVLGGVYSWFLQQATAMAQLAQSQLAFERQDKLQNVIQADYWDAPAENGQLAATNQKAPDRRGLTGSARLLADLYQLDQYAFMTDKRKLNLSQTFSLARMSPYEFEQFRQSGALSFNIPMSLFDRDFPGHYLRLIKRVRVSVVALIPPSQGIRATLTAAGVSSVVTSSDNGLTSQANKVRRDPELVALTSPINASGVFEMDAQSEMLQPFEAMGVDTLWSFEMPRAANPFDFRTIADVLLTIEYTALNNFDYRQQVIKSLPRTTSGERSFSLLFQFADAWYDLHNPDQSATPMTVTFKTWREDFPPNIESLKIRKVALFFSRAEDEAFEIDVDHLLFTPDGEDDAVGGGASTIDGLISTGGGNGSSWTAMIGESPVGEWELALPDRPDVRSWFADRKIQDILLVVTYGGRAPAWPA